MAGVDEESLEQAVLGWLSELGYLYAREPEIPADGAYPERAEYGQVVLERRLRGALVRINADVPDEAIEDALKQVTRTDSPSLIANNRAFHHMLTDGVDVSWQQQVLE